MIDITVSTLDAGAMVAPARVAAIKRAAFHAILDEEAGKLTAVPELIATIRREIG